MNRPGATAVSGFVNAPDQVRPVFDFSPIQILIVLAIALVVLGPKRLPEMGRSLGRGLREFKGSVAGAVDHDDETPEAAPEPAPALVGPAAHDESDESLDPVGLAGTRPAP